MSYDNDEFSRRDFLKISALVGVGAAAIPIGLLPHQQAAGVSQEVRSQDEDTGEDYDGPAATNERQTYDRALVRPQNFAVLPWSPAEEAESLAAGMRGCGFNLVMATVDALREISKSGLKAIVYDSSINVHEELDKREIRQRVKALVRREDGHRSVFGYYLVDEPGANLFPKLRMWVDAFREEDPGKVLYINLFPIYANPKKQLETETYEEYLESFAEIVRPDFVSYDHYALMADGSLRSSYFHNLEMVRRTALDHQIPFWNNALSTAHFDYAEASESGLRFQLYTSLAYGARGIGWFTYKTEPTANYRLGPIDQFGFKTTTWNLLRYVNLQLHGLGREYLKLRSKNIFHYPEIPEGCSGMESSQWVQGVTEGTSLLFGEFEDFQGQPYLMIVNKHLQQSTRFGFQTYQPRTAYWIDPYSGKSSPLEEWARWLAPGQGMLLRLQ